MTYSPTNIMAFDIDAQEKILKPVKVLDNVSRETKVLGDAIDVNKEGIALNKKATELNGQSFRKLFLGM